MGAADGQRCEHSPRCEAIFSWRTLYFVHWVCFGVIASALRLAHRSRPIESRATLGEARCKQTKFIACARREERPASQNRAAGTVSPRSNAWLKAADLGQLLGISDYLSDLPFCRVTVPEGQGVPRGLSLQRQVARRGRRRWSWGQHSSRRDRWPRIKRLTPPTYCLWLLGKGSLSADLDLVTGGAGFIGSHLVDRLIGQGRTVRVLDSFVVGRKSNLAQHAADPRLEIVKADVADTSAVAHAMTGVARVFHLAARADIVPSIEDPE